MKAVVSGEVQRLLFRSNVPDRAKHYGTVFLNQVPLPSVWRYTTVFHASTLVTPLHPSLRARLQRHGSCRPMPPHAASSAARDGRPAGW